MNSVPAWQRAATAATAAALAALTLTGCTSGPSAPHRQSSTAPVRSSETVPAGMESYAVKQTRLHITLPKARGNRAAKNAQAATTAVTTTASGRPVISTTTNADGNQAPQDAADRAAPPVATAITVDLTDPTDAAGVTAAVRAAVPKARVTRTHREALGIRFRVITPDKAGPAVRDRIRAVVDPILFGGYDISGDGHGTIDLVYVGDGVTSAGVTRVQRALADAFAVPGDRVSAQPLS